MTQYNVRVIRYIRPEETTSYNPSNMGGLTFVFDMDYVTRKVEARFSICSMEDNFNKDMGINAALDSECDEYDLDCFQKYADHVGGFTEAYVRTIDNSMVYAPLDKRKRTMLKTINMYHGQPSKF